MLEDKLQATPMDRHQIQQKDTQTKAAYQFVHDHHHSLCWTSIWPGYQNETGWENGWETSAQVIRKCNESQSYNGAVQRCNLQGVPEPADPPDQQQLQQRAFRLQLTSSPPSALRPSHRNSSSVQRLKDPPVVCSSLQSRDTWTLTDTHLHTVSCFLSNSVVRDKYGENNFTLCSLVKIMFHMSGVSCFWVRSDN